MWYKLRALALANHNNYVIHMQTLCRSVIWDHISFAGFLERGNNIFLCWGTALAVYSGLGSYSRRRTWRWRRGGVRGDTCGRHVGSAGVGWEGCCPALLHVGLQRGVMRDWLHRSLWGSHSQQHLLWPHQHPLTPFWQFHSCGVTIGADGFVSASTPSLPCNWMSGRPLLWPPNSLMSNHFYSNLCLA